MSAEINIFQSGKCLTGSEEKEEKHVNIMLQEMHKTTVPGLNRILIALNEDCSKIVSCFIDGVLYIKDGTPIIQTSR
jgi:hypothetical protein